MKYRAIAHQATRYGIRPLCRILEVSASGYYAWRKRPLSPRAAENRRLVATMTQVHAEIDPNYGSPRMCTELQVQELACSENRAARLMRANGLVAKTTRRYRSLTKPGRRPAAPDLVQRQFTVAEPNRVWATDITYIPTAEGHLLLAVVMDLYNRQVVGMAMREQLGAELVSAALQQAVARRSVAPGLIHHSDRDGLYSCAAYRHLLAQHGMVPSNSRKGNCWDNAVVESFFAVLKREKVAFERFRSRAEARRSLFAWIEGHYNRRRRHSTLGNLSPVEFAECQNRP